MLHMIRSCVLQYFLRGVATWGFGFSVCVREVFRGLAKQSKSWNQPVQLTDGTLETWANNGNTNLDREISDGGRECCAKRRMCCSRKRCHEPLSTTWVLSEKIGNLKNVAHDSELCTPWFSIRCSKLGIWLFGMREGGFRRACKAVKQLEPTCLVAIWYARDLRPESTLASRV